MASTRQRLLKFLVALACISFVGCTSITTNHLRNENYPTVSVWGNPSTSMAISWFDAHFIKGVELRSADGMLRRVPSERHGEVTRVLIDNLTPGETYEYRPLSDDGWGDGPWYSFTTVDERNAYEEQPLRFAVAGDLQPFNDETVRTTSLVMNKLSNLNPEFVLLMGDVAEVGTSIPSWRLATSVLSKAGAEIPIVATAGNHDYYYVFPSAEIFKTFFPAPYPQKDTSKHTWYSVTIGPAHIAVMDTEVKGKWIDEQIAWLENDLANAKTDGAEWLFVAMHRPLITITSTSKNLEWTPRVLPLLAEAGVDAVFWGHQHLYQHFAYQYGKNGLVFDPTHKAAEKPIHFFTAGTSGARVDSIYHGFFTHAEVSETWNMYDLETEKPVELTFARKPWPQDSLKTVAPGVRYQNPEIYPKAGSYYSYPFETAEDAESGIYSDDPSIRYAQSAEFLGFTYAETSIHYLWVEIDDNTCTITAYYADGPDGNHGQKITSPHGRAESWVLTNN